MWSALHGVTLNVSKEMILTANLHFSGATNEKETKNIAAKDGLVQRGVFRFSRR